MSTILRKIAAAAVVALTMGSLCAQPAAPADASTPPVLTRARVSSFSKAPGGKFHLRLKLMPRAKLPFTTQTFTVADRALLAGISEGDWVKFAMQRIDGENTVTSLQVVAACRRFQPCD